MVFGTETYRTNAFDNYVRKNIIDGYLAMVVEVSEVVFEDLYQEILIRLDNSDEEIEGESGWSTMSYYHDYARTVFDNVVRLHMEGRIMENY